MSEVLSLVHAAEAETRSGVRALTFNSAEQGHQRDESAAACGGAHDDLTAQTTSHTRHFQWDVPAKDPDPAPEHPRQPLRLGGGAQSDLSEPGLESPLYELTDLN